MIAARLRQLLFLLFCLALPGSYLVSAQSTPVKVGPLTVNAPPGWKAQQDAFNPGIVQIVSPDSTLQQYLHVQLLPPQQVSEDAREYHAIILQRLSAFIPTGSPQQSGVTGKFIWTRYVMQRPGGLPEAMIFYSAKAGSLFIGIEVEATNQQLLTRNLPAIEAMMRGATLEGAPGAPVSSSAPPASSAGSATGSSNATGPATLGDYIYATPAGWATKRNPDSIILESPLLGTSEKCFIFFWPMRPAGPDLVADTNRFFAEAWGSFELRNRDGRGGDMPPVIVRGTSGQGWDYVIVKRGIGPRGSPETRLGFALGARLGNRLALISGLSKDPLVSACFGELYASLWPRFFYSLSFKDWTPSGDQAAAMRRRIAGVWIGGGATAADRMVFSGNGRYGGASASQQYNVINSREVLTTTTAFFGDGAYSLRGNSITLTPNNGRAAQHGFIRVEEESKDEGRTWVETLYLLRTSEVDGKEYEMKYQRSR